MNNLDNSNFSVMGLDNINYLLSSIRILVRIESVLGTCERIMGNEHRLPSNFATDWKKCPETKSECFNEIFVYFQTLF